MNSSYLLRTPVVVREKTLKQLLLCPTNAKMCNDRDCLGSLGKGTSSEPEQKLQGLRSSIQVLCAQEKCRNKKSVLKCLWLEFNTDFFPARNTISRVLLTRLICRF